VALERNRLQAFFTGDLTPAGRAVVDALADAREASTGFLLACGLLPEVNEACTEGLHDQVHALAERHFQRERAVATLRGALAERGLGDADVEHIAHLVTAIATADTTAAYLFGLAAGLGLGSLDRRLAD
jgi:hypothetical protein